jgi:hypothetical protein
MIPTCLGVVAVDHVDAEESNGFLLTSSPPLLYQFGHDSPSTNVKVFKRIVDHMASLCVKRSEAESRGTYIQPMVSIITHPTFSSAQWLDIGYAFMVG